MIIHTLAPSTACETCTQCHYWLTCCCGPLGVVCDALSMAMRRCVRLMVERSRCTTSVLCRAAGTMCGLQWFSNKRTPFWRYPATMRGGTRRPRWGRKESGRGRATARTGLDKASRTAAPSISGTARQGAREPGTARGSRWHVRVINIWRRRRSIHHGLHAATKSNSAALHSQRPICTADTEYHNELIACISHTRGGLVCVGWTPRGGVAAHVMSSQPPHAASPSFVSSTRTRLACKTT